MKHVFIVKIKGSDKETVYPTFAQFIRSIGRMPQYVTFTRMINKAGFLDFGDVTVTKADYIENSQKKQWKNDNLK